MKNAIIINGIIYELVHTISVDPCETCDLRDICINNSAYCLCVDVHNAGEDEHYVKRQKGGEE